VAALTGTSLGRAALLLAATDVAHTLDHVRQGRPLGAEVYVAAVAGWIALGVLLALVAARHPLATPFAAAVGGSFVVGLLAVHVLPRWSAVSDPYADARVDALSWALVAVPVVAALVLAGVALHRSWSYV
jgi:hypothetical protein